MPPPELAGDAPVLNASQPVVVNLRPALGKKLHRAIRHARARLLDARVFQKPLLAQARLDRHVGALAVADVVLIRLLLLQRAEFARATRRRPCALRSDRARRGRRRRRSFITPLRMHDCRSAGKLVPLADLEVGLVVRGRDFQARRCRSRKSTASSPTIGMAVLIISRGSGRRTCLPMRCRVARVLGIHGDRGIAGDGLRPGGGDRQETARLFHHLHFEIIEQPLLRLHDDLLVAQRGERDRAPVDHAFAAIDQAFFVKIHEDALHAARVVLIHREARRATNRTSSRAARSCWMMMPPYFSFHSQMLADERLAAKVVAVLHLAVFAQGALDDILRRDAGVIRAGQPEDFLSEHPRAAREDVLDGVVQHMAEGQHAGDIRRRDDDRVGGPLCGDALGIGSEAFVLQPEIIPLCLDSGRRIGGSDLGHRGAEHAGAPGSLATPCCRRSAGDRSGQRGFQTAGYFFAPSKRPLQKSRRAKTCGCQTSLGFSWCACWRSSRAGERSSRITLKKRGVIRDVAFQYVIGGSARALDELLTYLGVRRFVARLPRGPHQLPEGRLRARFLADHELRKPASASGQHPSISRRRQPGVRDAESAA